MPRTEFSPSITSRPVYPGLTPQGATPAIMLAEGPGAEAILDLAALGAKMYREAPSYASVLERYRKALADARMGTTLYLAGSEGMIGQAVAEALAAGLPPEAIQTEHRGTIARRMQCVHCKGVTENVTTDPFVCSHCGLTLFVRDHFSRRLGAFQGVCVDAETPGIVPAVQEIKP